MAKDWKERLGVVYSTNSEFQYKNEAERTTGNHSSTATRFKGKSG